jgi:hypothetical protein
MKFEFLRKLFSGKSASPPKLPDGTNAAIGDKMPDGTTYAGTPPLDDFGNGVRAYVSPPKPPDLKR